MSDPAGHYTDPLEDALSQSAQRVAQLASLLGAATEVAVRARALRQARATHGETDQAIEQYELEARQHARMRWAPAHDRGWLSRADLLQVARVWSAAASYADTDPVAAAAQRKCEERLRELHPYAMARYDRLIRDGMSALDAMQEAAPLFGRSPQARPGEAGAERAALDPRLADDVFAWTGASVPDATAGTDPAPSQTEAMEQRGRQIAARLQDRARARGHGELGSEDLAIILEAVTNLPEKIVERIAHPSTPHDADHAAALSWVSAPGEAAESFTGRYDHVAPASASRTAAQITAESFPYAAADFLKTASAKGTPATDSPRYPQPRRQERRPRRPL
jgi:hypothetical protein